MNTEGLRLFTCTGSGITGLPDTTDGDLGCRSSGLFAGKAGPPLLGSTLAVRVPGRLLPAVGVADVGNGVALSLPSILSVV